MNSPESKLLHLPILIEQDEDDVYIISCPLFKGCHTYGKTIEEALENIREVIDLCVEEEKDNLAGMNRFVGFREMQIPLKSVVM